MKGFRSMGADIDIAHGLVIARAKELKGTHIYMDKDFCRMPQSIL